MQQGQPLRRVPRILTATLHIILPQRFSVSQPRKPSAETMGRPVLANGAGPQSSAVPVAHPPQQVYAKPMLVVVSTAGGAACWHLHRNHWRMVVFGGAHCVVPWGPLAHALGLTGQNCLCAAQRKVCIARTDHAWLGGRKEAEG